MKSKSSRPMKEPEMTNEFGRFILRLHRMSFNVTAQGQADEPRRSMLEGCPYPGVVLGNEIEGNSFAFCWCSMHRCCAINRKAQTERWGVIEQF